MPAHNDELQAFLDSHPDIEVFEVMLPDIAGGLRGKWVTRDKIHKVMAGGLKLPISALAFDVWGRDVEAWVFDSGDGDGMCEADINTLAPVPWAQRPTGQVMMSLREIDGSPSVLDTRFIIKGLMARFAKLGLTPVLASEMEFYLLQHERDAQGRPLAHPDRQHWRRAGQRPDLQYRHDGRHVRIDARNTRCLYGPAIAG